MKIYINTDEMISDRNSISQRIDRIQELFDKTDKGMNLSKEKEIWLGCTSDALYLKYEVHGRKITTGRSRDKFSGTISERYAWRRL